jgi:predicted AAA+ superfamily ATPase
VRRCGKSCLLEWLCGHLLDSGVPAANICYVRLDSFGVPLNPTAEWLTGVLQQQMAQADAAHPFYVLLDEIQDVAQWERLVRQLHTQENTDVYLTGSNAYMLSGDLATHIGGRYREICVHPLSFAEYQTFCQAFGVAFASQDEQLQAYLKFGGMPALFRLREFSQPEIEQALSSIFETIVLNDVAKRARVTDVALLERLVRYTFSTSGSLFSTNSIVGALKAGGRKTSAETVESYLRALEAALLVRPCEQFGLAGKKILRPQRKFYPVDTGLRNLMSGFAQVNTGFVLENAVHNELRRRGWDVQVGALLAGEVDFVCQRAGRRAYVQVTESLADARVLQREIAPLQQLRDSWPKTIITADWLHCGTTPDGVQIVNVAPWLLGQ